MPDTRSYAARKARESDRLWAEAMRRERVERLREKLLEGEEC